jgi:acetyl-CoA acetyltransferase
VFSPWLSPGERTSPSIDAAAAAFAAAGITPADVQVAQVQDTDSGAEIIHLGETGLCADQEAAFVRGDFDIDGRLPINTDGGCLANGEPVGASGLRQVYEVVTQLQGRAEGKQVPGSPRVGFTHVYGAPGISACTVLTTTA